MRFCLKCRSFSGGGPLCTQCGRSFGGRLCQGRTRHLNPYDARSCNYCGTSNLQDGATSIPLGWISRLIIIAVMLFFGRWLLLALSHTQNLSFQGLTGYRDVRVWLIEKFVNLLIILLVFSFLSSFIPGDVGKQFRSIMFSSVGHAITLFFKVLERGIFYSGKLLLWAIGIEEPKEKVGIAPMKSGGFV